MKTIHQTTKAKVIYGLLGGTLGTSIILLADFLGGEFLPLWIYALLWAFQFTLWFWTTGYRTHIQAMQNRRERNPS
jgi:hypothetical protein